MEEIKKKELSKRDNIIKWSIVSIFVGLYAMVSAISTIHVVDFFKLSNPEWLAVTLAIAFEVGAAASLAAIIILDKTSKSMVWGLFTIITLMQMMGNMYFAYTHLNEYRNWSELFGLIDDEPIFQKRVLSIVSGAILPLVALGFIKSLVDYIKPSQEVPAIVSEPIKQQVPYVSDDFQIGPNGAYEHTDEVQPIEEALGIENTEKDENTEGINNLEEYLGLNKVKKKMNPHVRPGVN